MPDHKQMGYHLRMASISGEQIADNQKLMDTVIHLIATTLDQGRIRIKPSSRLLSGQKLFDSFRLMEFIVRLEDTFNIRIPDDDLDPDIFDSPRTIVRYLRSRLQKDV
jgi:acyl carrier protein